MKRWIMLALVTAPVIAWACFTSERAAELGKIHPDLKFEDLAHHMHGQERIPYEFGGPAPCTDGMSDIFPCQGVELAGWLELPEIGGGSGADSWGWKDEQTGRYFALMGRTNGVAFVEITDPDNPVYLGNLPRPSGVSNSVWTDLKVYEDHVFVVADGVSGHGVMVFDLTRLRNVDSPPQTFSMDAHYTEFGCAHNIAINADSGFAYATGGGFSCSSCSAGLHMIDIRDPASPKFAGCFADDGYTHDVQCVNYQGPDAEHQGKEICFASNEDSVTVVDVSDKANPVQLGRHTYNSSAYTHQGWLTEDQRYFVTDDELDESGGQTPDGRTRTLVFDFADLEDAPEPAEFLASGSAIDHNQYVIGDYTFQANYKRGLRILRIDDPGAGGLTEVAYFDTFPSEDALGFSGAWNVYPFFDNGIVLVSDINRGLFVLRVTEPDVLKALTEFVFEDGFESD